MSAAVIAVDDATFEDRVLDAPAAVLVDFWAPWCRPCVALAPVLERIAAARPNLTVAKVNLDESESTAARCDVLALPTVVLYRQGRELGRLSGSFGGGEIEAKLLDEQLGTAAT